MSVAVAQHLLQSASNPDHFFDLAMGHSTPDIVTAYVSFLAERVERANKLRIFSQRQFEGLNDPVMMTVPGRAIAWAARAAVAACSAAL